MKQSVFLSFSNFKEIVPIQGPIECPEGHGSKVGDWENWFCLSPYSSDAYWKKGSISRILQEKKETIVIT